jgi:hypothetical protein
VFAKQIAVLEEGLPRAPGRERAALNVSVARLVPPAPYPPGPPAAMCVTCSASREKQVVVDALQHVAKQVVVMAARGPGAWHCEMSSTAIQEPGYRCACVT